MQLGSGILLVQKDVQVAVAPPGHVQNARPRLSTTPPTTQVQVPQILPAPLLLLPNLPPLPVLPPLLQNNPNRHRTRQGFGIIPAPMAAQVGRDLQALAPSVARRLPITVLITNK